MTPSGIDHASPLVLVVDSSPEIVALASVPLLQNRYCVISAQSGEDTLSAVREVKPDVVVLDLSAADFDGLDLCRKIRAASDAFIVGIADSGADEDRIAGFEAGVDDYLVKPFAAQELVLRVGSMLRRHSHSKSVRMASEPEVTVIECVPPQPLQADAHAEDTFRVDSSHILHVGNLVMDTLAREVRVEGRDVELTRIEFELLQLLLEQRNIVLSRDQIMEAVWGPNWFGDSHVIETHISKLRKKLGDDSRMQRYVRVIRGVGYRLGPCAEVRSPSPRSMPQLAVG
jgi:DNA-binding response OmpR family regulator